MQAGASGLITLIVMGMFKTSMALVGCNYGNELLTDDDASFIEDTLF